MKKTILILLTFSLIACGKSKEEQMLYDFKAKSIKELFNSTPKDLNFKINSIKFDRNVIAKDSAKHYKDKLSIAWFGKNPNKEQSDTLTFKFVIQELESMINIYQEMIISNIKLDRDYKNYEYKKNRDETIESKAEIMIMKMYYDDYIKTPDSILCKKYLSNYSLNNPSLNNVKQTFDRYLYSNKDDSKIIAEEDKKE